MGVKKQGRRPVRVAKASGIESFGYDNVDDFHERTFSGGRSDRSTRDVIRVTADDDTDDDDDDVEANMTAMGLPSARILDSALRADSKRAERQAEIALGSSEDVDDDDGDDDDDGNEVVAMSNRKAWGKQAANFYEEGLEDDDEKSSCDNSDAEIDEEEAVMVHRDGLKALRMEDFELPSVQESATSLPEFDEEEEVSALLTGFDEPLNRRNTCTDISKLSKAEMKLMIKRDHPEMLGLLKEIKDKSADINEKILPILQKIENRDLLTTEGFSYLEMKYHLLLCYLQYLLFYILLKLHGRDITDHPVIERLVELKTLMSQLRPLDKKLQPQIARLLSAITESNSAKRILRPRLEMMTTDNDQVARGKGAEDEEAADEQDQVYKPPKMVAVPYTENAENSLKQKLEKEEKRKEERIKKSEIVATLREEFQQTPLELSDLRTADHVTSKEVEKILQKQMEKELFEQDNMYRLPITKTEKKALKLLKEKQKTVLAGGSTLDDLANFAERALDVPFDDPTIGSTIGKKSVKLSDSLNAVRQAAVNLERQSSINNKRKERDGYVMAREPKRNKPSDGIVDRHFKDDDIEDDVVDEDIPGVVQEALQQKALKKKAKEDTRRAKITTKPLELEVTDGKRGTTYQILKNKGLTRKRKKIEGNARAHNRLKFEKKMKKIQGMRQKPRTATGSGAYEGETTGIRTHLKKSITLAS